MTREEIDAAIKRHADFELLYDKPYEDKKKVRVAGPFTVERLSPHRSLAFAGRRRRADRPRREAAKDADAPNFEQSILDNLAQGRHPERPHGRAHRVRRVRDLRRHVHPGDRRAACRRRRRRRRRGSAIAIGPQYGTVSPTYVKNAAREAIDAEDVDLLCVLGFAFDPQRHRRDRGRRRHRRGHRRRLRQRRRRAQARPASRC